MKLLHLSCVWPEPRASAAGFRVLNLVEAALREGWQVTCASTGRLNEHVAELAALGVSTSPVQPNDPAFDSIQLQREDYVWYYKGGQIMYTLADYIGEDKVNLALHNFIMQYRYANAANQVDAAQSTSGAAAQDPTTS